MPFVHGHLGIPFDEFVFHASPLRVPFKWRMGWGGLIAEFPERMAEFSIFGQRVVAGAG
jgi:hypothetical protein